MLKTMLIGTMACVGAFAAVGLSKSMADSEITCRVNVPAFLTDLRAANGLSPDVNADMIKNILKQKP